MGQKRGGDGMGPQFLLCRHTWGPLTVHGPGTCGFWPPLSASQARHPELGRATDRSEEGAHRHGVSGLERALEIQTNPGIKA